MSNSVSPTNQSSIASFFSSCLTPKSTRGKVTQAFILAIVVSGGFIALGATLVLTWPVSLGLAGSTLICASIRSVYVKFQKKSELTPQKWSPGEIEAVVKKFARYKLADTVKSENGNSVYVKSGTEYAKVFKAESDKINQHVIFHKYYHNDQARFNILALSIDSTEPFVYADGSTTE